MATTELQNMVNPEVMAGMIGAELPSAIRFSPLAEVDRTLQGRPGDTITLPKWEYIGDASTVAEGAAIDLSAMSSSTEQWTVAKAAKGVELTDEALLSGYGDPLGEATRQLGMSIASKIDRDLVAAANTTSLVYDGSANKITAFGVANALDVFGEEDEGTSVLVIHPDQRAHIRTDENYVRASELGDRVISSGVIGELYGAQVLVSNKINHDTTNGVYENLIIKPGGLGIFLKRDVSVERDRDIVRKVTVVTADQHYVAALIDESKVVKATFSDAAGGSAA